MPELTIALAFLVVLSPRMSCVQRAGPQQ